MIPKIILMPIRTIVSPCVFYLIISCLLSLSPAWAQAYKGAACVIFVGNEVVLVRDLLSNRLSFPGGYVNRSESPPQAAQRETFEETGLNVSVGPQIGAANQSAQYLCKSIKPIPLLSTKGFESRPLIYALSAPDFSVEIRQVYLVQPQSLTTDELRFPLQVQSLTNLDSYPKWQSQAQFISNSAIPISDLHKLELTAIDQFQHWLAPQADLPFRLLNLMGENAMFFVLVPIIWAYSGWKMGLHCLLLLIASAELNNILKVLLAQPRPFHLSPPLQRMEAYGFGMPSGHTLVATAFWGYCWSSFKHLLPEQYHRSGLGILVCLLIGCALARVYWGVHFFSDVLVGMGLGLMMAYIFIQLNKSKCREQILIAKKQPWAFGLIIIASTSFFTPGSLSSQLAGLTLGLFLGLCSGKTQALQEAMPSLGKGKCLLAGLGIIGIVTLDRAAKAIVSHQADSIIIILVYFLFYLLIGLWLMEGMYFLPFRHYRSKLFHNIFNYERDTMTGHIAAIFVAPSKHAGQIAVDAVQLKTGKGIVGDRFYGLSRNNPGRNLTLIESEAIEEFNRLYNQSIGLNATRRNLVTRGIRLNNLVGKSIKIGNVLCLGIELCEPCKVMARHFSATSLSQADIIHAFTGKGGLGWQ